MTAPESIIAICQTPRLLLRHFLPSDLDGMADMLADSEVMRFSLGTRTRDETRQWLGRTMASYAENGFGLWAVDHRRDGRLIGFCGPSVQEVDERREVEIGYRLAKAYWGQGLATEAAMATRDDAVGRLGIERLISIIDPLNTASIGVAEKIGMQLESETVKWQRTVRIYALSATRQNKMSLKS